jgi:hypothetical protein
MRARTARRFFLPLLCGLACAATLPATAGAVVVGIGDDNAAMFSDPHFQALHIRTARATVMWDAALLNNTVQLDSFAAWLRAATAAHVTPLVSFFGDGNYKGNHDYAPPLAQYKAAVKAFMADFPSVRYLTPWNEPDWVYRPSLALHPKLAAGYYNVMKQTCRCTVLAGDVYLAANQLRPWLKQYIKGLHYKPDGWALHDYNDVRTHTTSQLQVLMKLTKGPIWLDEISGVERRGHWQYRNQTIAAATRDESFLFSLPRRFPRITHIYHYQWISSASAGWDSAVLNADGSARPAYSILQRAAKGH